MFKIGEFSRISQVAVTTLRYYDEVGLIKPAVVDEYTSYRYYTLNQLPRLNRILALRNLGFSLEQIAQLLQEKLTPAEIRQMLVQRQAELRRRVQEEQERLASVEARLRQMEQEGMMSDYDVVLKGVEAVHVASIRAVVPKYSDIGGLFNEVIAYLGQHGSNCAGPGIAIWYDPEYRERDVDGEAAIPIQGALSASERIKVRDLPAVEAMACALHKGSFDGLPNAYAAIFAWANTSGYQVNGPIREVTLQMDPHGDPADYLTEVHVPVVKTAA